MNKTRIKNFLAGVKTNINAKKKVKEKIVIIESDDWGAIRTPSVEALRAFEKYGFDLRNSVYKNDALASQTDLEDLFNLLLSFKNTDGEHPIVTANAIMANPDFKKIKESDYKKYFYERFTETFKKYPAHNKNLSIWEKGMQSKVFQPQFHGREHLNVNRWMKALQSGSQKIRFSFDWESTSSGEGDYSFMESLDWSNPKEINEQRKIIKEGLAIFEKTFEFKPKSFIAPCYTWDNKLEPFLADQGINCIQGIRVQKSPTGQFGNYHRIHHFFGEINNCNTFYNIRNVFFEPSTNINYDWVDAAMARIHAAFLFDKPAVISSHRINYIGFINPKNKENGLLKLKQLLTAILKKWPDVKFITTDQLEKYILKNE